MGDKGIGIVDKVWTGYTADQKVRLNYTQEIVAEKYLNIYQSAQAKR